MLISRSPDTNIGKRAVLKLELKYKFACHPGTQGVENPSLHSPYPHSQWFEKRVSLVIGEIDSAFSQLSHTHFFLIILINSTDGKASDLDMLV